MIRCLHSVSIFFIAAIGLSCAAMNVSAQPITGDLEVYGVTITPSPAPSASFTTVGFTVNNRGPGRGQMASVEVLVNGVQRGFAQPLTVFNSVNVPQNFTFNNILMPAVPNLASQSATVQVRITDSINSSNNTGTAFVTVQGPRPNLTFATPSDWSAPIVVSNSMNAVNNAAQVLAGSPVLASFGWRNAGDAMPSPGPGVQVELLRGGVVVFDSPFAPMLAGEVRNQRNVSLGNLPPGSYTLTLRLDGIGSVVETSESDNSTSYSFSVLPAPFVDLAGFTPAGWNASLMVAAQPNTLTPQAVMRATDTAYLDLAYANFGTANCAPFDVQLRINGILLDTFRDPGLLAGDGRFGADAYSVINLPAGIATFTLVLDSAQEIAESDNGNNTLQATIAVDPCSSDAQGPTPQSVGAGAGVTLVGRAAAGSYGVTYQWQRNGQPISNGASGASAGGGVVAGANGVLASPSTTSPLVLTISQAQPGDSGAYRIVFANVCGPRATASGLLTVAPVGCDSIDFNGNGVFPEDQDVLDFFNVLAGGNCPTATCNDLDFNNNGVFPEDQDVIAFFAVLAGGACS